MYCKYGSHQLISIAVFHCVYYYEDLDPDGDLNKKVVWLEVALMRYAV